MHKTIHTVVFQALDGGGNPCPVTLNADNLTPEQMQAMTADFGQEAAFLSRPSKAGADFRIRYFVPLHETEMCLHATIGSATVLVKKGLVAKSPVFFETAMGTIRIDWEMRGENVDVSVRQFLPRVLDVTPSREKVARALNITAEQLGDRPIQSVSTSRFKLIVPLRSRAVLDGLKPDFEYLRKLCDEFSTNEAETTGFYPFALERGADDKPVFFARQFPKRSGYDEDPATGVAASALGAYAVLNGILPASEGWNCCEVLQGFAMGRPSVICADTKIESGRIIDTRVRGNAILIED